MKQLIQYITIFFLILGFSAITSAESSEPPSHFDYFTQDLNIREKFEFDTNNTLLQQELKKCACNGNYVCSGSMGSILFDNEKFTDAYWYLLQASKHFDGHHDQILGAMYADGKGVLINYDKSIHFFEKVAKHGNGQAAYNLYAVYNKKAGLYNPLTKADESNWRHNRIYAHAWGRVAASLGHQKSYLQNGETGQLLKELEKEMELFTLMGWHNDTHVLSIAICNEVKGCNQ